VAWAFELTPEGLKRTREVDPDASITPVTGQRINHLIIGVLAVAVAYLLIDKFMLSTDDSTHPSADARIPQTPESVSLTSIAVLPFVNMSADPEQEYFADGISEELLNLLAKIEDFKVAGRTSSFAFKGQNQDLRVIAEKLGVATVLEGSVRKDGDQVRVTAQLVKADDGYHLWSETYDRRLDSIFAIQDEISGKVVTAIKTKLLADDDQEAVKVETAALTREKPTENMEAYTSFLRGQHLIKKRTGDDMFQALSEFRHAVSLDPNFAEAHVGVANGYSLLANYGYRNIEEVGPLAAASIEQALTLKPDLGEAWAARGLLEELRGASPEQTLPLLEKAVALNPNDAQSLAWMANDYAAQGQYEERYAILERAYALDPLSPIILFNMADAAHILGLHEDAQRLADELESLMPNQGAPFRLRARLAWRDADFVAETRWYHRAVTKDPGSIPALLALSEKARDYGALDAAERYARQARDINPTSTMALEHLAYAMIFQDRTEEARKLLEQGQRLYPEDKLLLSLEAELAYLEGDYDRTLAILETVFPELFTEPPEIQDGTNLWWAHNVAWMYRAKGQDDKSDAVIAAVENFVEPRLPNYPKTSVDWLAARTAAVPGDREGMVRHLRNMVRTGEQFGAFLRDPMFLQYADDPDVAVVFDEMRAADRKAREELTAEGIF
jgi:TolB-like protein/Tfp pilus assembly protein PilF